MKTRACSKVGLFHVFNQCVLRPVIFGVSLAALCSGCVTRNEAGLVRSGVEEPNLLGALEVGSVGVAMPETAGKFSFTRATGQINSVGEGAGSAARNVLLTPNLGDPLVEAPTGVIEFIVAPFAAGYGAIRASVQRLSPGQLEGAEADLIEAFKSVARQDRLRECYLKTVTEKSQVRAFPLDSATNSPGHLDGVGTIVETRIEELKLEPVKGDYCVLRIKARARVLRVSDRALLIDRGFEYQSGKALFIEWTQHGGLESVADTGYRVLAAQMARDTLGSLLPEPVLLGAGQELPRGQASRNAAMSVKASPSAASGPVRFLNCEVNTGSRMEIYSTGTASSFLLNPAMTKSEAISEAVADTEWVLDGLQDCRNSVVQVGACAVAIPIGLWKQTSAGVQGLWQSKLESATAALTAAASQSRPRDAITYEVARTLSTQSSLNVALVSAPSPNPSLGQSAARPFGAQATLASFKTGLSPATSSAPGVGDTALEIAVSYAGFTAVDGVNPRFPLTVEAQATLFRKEDGQPLYSCPIQYRSVRRTLGSWAADDARLFREEQARCYSQIADSVVKELITRGVVAPVQRPAALLVNR
jgi:hypothetical protein